MKTTAKNQKMQIVSTFRMLQNEIRLQVIMIWKRLTLILETRKVTRNKKEAYLMVILIRSEVVMKRLLALREAICRGRRNNEEW